MEWILVHTGVGALVYLEVFTSGKHFTTAGEGTRERLLTGVHPNVVH